MRSAIVILLPSFLAQAYAQALFVASVDNLVDKLFDRALEAWPLQRLDLDDTTLGKGTAHLTLPRAPIPLPSTSGSLPLAFGMPPSALRLPLSALQRPLPMRLNHVPMRLNHLPPPAAKAGDGDSNFVSQAAFKLTEVFAQFGKRPQPNQTTPRSNAEALSIDAAADLIKEEHEAAFWTTGSMNFDVWETGCIFADPFSSFGGDDSVSRFQKNAAGLAGLLEEGSNLRMTSFNVEKFNEPQIIDAVHPAQAVVKVGWSFSGKLKLPWRPVLASAGTTAHYLSAYSGRIVRYEESWISKPWDVVRRIFVPTKG